ncbi:DUF7093 family protein [Natronobiforma cellulositropha]|uniref:DUF7093 family protein n=1 Tax=Natronobiforma cellulositropha TaxID=1679076 RepID=UPI0021D591C7|nr:hypothetical protein [Natronobiforma cellulositropha]
MVLRCSLLGHDYGEPQVDHEREERGSEVVVTVREYEECARCGERHLISENTEVRSLAPEPTPDSSPTPDATETTDSPPEEPTDSAASADADGATTDDAAFAPDFPTDEHGEPITDDGEILEDEPAETGDRERGAWPESDDVGPPVGAENEPAAWPVTDAETSEEWTELEESEWEDVEPVDDAVFVDSESVDAGQAEGAPDAEGVTDAGTGIASAQSAPVPGEAATREEDVPTEFFCPRCSFVAPGDRGSLRPGDICPECRRGYLGERDRA